VRNANSTLVASPFGPEHHSLHIHSVVVGVTGWPTVPVLISVYSHAMIEALVGDSGCIHRGAESQVLRTHNYLSPLHTPQIKFSEGVVYTCGQIKGLQGGFVSRQCLGSEWAADASPKSHPCVCASRY
jgi:hypothetical protein